MPGGSNHEPKRAALVGVEARYISDVKKLAAEEPDLLEEIRPGEETIQGADDFADAISARWQDSVLAIIDVGKLLLGAKHTLPHGEFGPMIESDSVPFGWSTANQLMAIAGHSLLANSDHGKNLPPSWRTIYELTKAPDDAVGWRMGALAHTLTNKVEAAYRRGDLFEKRRQLITAWSTYCKHPQRRSSWSFAPN